MWVHANDTAASCDCQATVSEALVMRRIIARELANLVLAERKRLLVCHIQADPPA